VVLNLFVDLERNTEYRSSDPLVKSFVYEGELAGSSLKLRLDSKELMGLWKGDGTIYQTHERSSRRFFKKVEQFGPVFLVVDVTNESKQAVQVNGAYVDVEQSSTDLQPCLTIRTSYVAPKCDPKSSKPGDFYPTFELVNAGWGAVRNASVTYAFGDESGPRTQSFTVRVGDFGESQQVSTLSGLQTSGLDIKGLACSRFECPSEDALPGCLAKLQRSGTFGKFSGGLFLDGPRVFSRASGRIDYEWVDGQGVSHSRQSPISVDVPLLKFDVDRRIATVAAPGPVERNIQPLKLTLDRRQYRLPVGIRGGLGPNQNRRFALSLSADKSSAHFFKLVLQLAGGSTVSSRRVDLLYFRPR